MGQVRHFEPEEELLSKHREEVYQLARSYIIGTFNIEVLEEGAFNPVRFNSMGVWGDFEVRLKELGGDRYEVRGWLSSTGNGGAKMSWSVVVRYRLEDPDAWRYRRLDRVYSNEPEYLGWSLDQYRSSQYSAEYTREYEYSLVGK